MEFEGAKIELDRIDAADNRFRLTTQSGVKDLIASIRSVGLMNPLILLDGPDRLRIVAGFRRLEALKKMDRKTVRGRILGADTPLSHCVMLAVGDNSLQRPLNIVETAHALNMLADVFPETTRLSEAASVLGLPSHFERIEKLIPLWHLPEKIRQPLLSGAIAPAMARKLGRLPETTGCRLAGIFSSLRLSQGKQREVLGLCSEIAIREDLTIAEVLDHAEKSAILGADDPDRTRKTADLRRYLRQRRFPALSAAENDFDQRRKALKLGEGVQLSAPAHFEGATYTLSLKFQTLEELRRHRKTLDGVIGDSILGEMLDGSRGFGKTLKS